METAVRAEPRTQRVGVGRVELEFETRPGFETLIANLRDRVVVLLLLILMAAQTADIATTYRALAGRAYVEENPLFRMLLNQSPVAGYTVKVLAISLLALVAMSTLRGRRAATALAVAAVISITAPLLNFSLLFGS